MRSLLMLPAIAWLGGCAAVPVGDRGLCDGLRPLAEDHAEALIADGGDDSVVTGARLIAGLRAGCKTGPGPWHPDDVS